MEARDPNPLGLADSLSHPPSHPLSEGILRAQQPARPTVDCLFRDVMKDGRTALKIWSRNKVRILARPFKPR